ncbi:succinate dehydrogenase cytochrome b558 subunit [Mangrovibacillus cuniculi]|uniref:Succinate dehydrogenase n=1 Tax=Mangrovibacillus cuniculi TaxID=2593652 RepID=A0A7S8CC95_9BACI|nr:succinate dehydrogenase cytochrome b558 subunit [Mangrovibacillus cuniculi]QPC47158.1 succinate dehydrogenase [Mangrovibacillus cuniculi]
MAGNREFWLRRIHSLLGVIPVGLFLTQHLVVNHFATKGEQAFNDAAHFMESLPFRYALEIFIIFLPLLFHAVYGIYIAFTAKNNTSRFGTFRNWMFVFQRITGVLLVIWITWHVWETRVAAAFGAEVNFQMMENILSNPLMVVWYVIGVIAAIFHFANGLWSFGVSWGLTLSPKSQLISTYVTMGLFVILSVVGLRAIFAFV